jgi:aristolochene synthase
MGLCLNNEEIEAVKEINMNTARQLPLLNDICSWEKEFKKARESKEDGARLCSSVKIITDTLKIDAEAAQRLLWHMCRELEFRHVKLVDEVLAVYPHLSNYCRAVGYHMSGQEVWNLQSERFNFSHTLGITHPSSEGC